MKKLYTLIIGLCFAFASYAGSTDSSSLNDYFCQVKSAPVFLSHLKKLLPPKQEETNQELLFRYFREHGSAIANPADVSFDESTRILRYRTTATDDSKLKPFVVKLTKDS
jgi:hypothetical protein